MLFVISPVIAQWKSVRTAIRIIMPWLRYLINCGDYWECNSADQIEGADTKCLCLCCATLSRADLEKMELLDTR